MMVVCVLLEKVSEHWRFTRGSDQVTRLTRYHALPAACASTTQGTGSGSVSAETSAQAHSYLCTPDMRASPRWSVHADQRCVCVEGGGIPVGALY